MRFYTVEKTGKQEVVISVDGGKTAYALNELGFSHQGI